MLKLHCEYTENVFTLAYDKTSLLTINIHFGNLKYRLLKNHQQGFSKLSLQRFETILHSNLILFSSL